MVVWHDAGFGETGKRHGEAEIVLIEACLLLGCTLANVLSCADVTSSEHTSCLVRHCSKSYNSKATNGRGTLIVRTDSTYAQDALGNLFMAGITPALAGGIVVRISAGRGRRRAVGCATFVHTDLG